jgi:hypothetical protein
MKSENVLLSFFLGASPTVGRESPYVSYVYPYFKSTLEEENGCDELAE